VADALRATRPITLLAGSATLFEGRVERRALRLGEDGRFVSAVAFADYHSARERARSHEVYFHSTLAEIAERIATSLGLRANVEVGTTVHDRVERSGDPLVFLRELGRRSEFEFGITRGELLFRRDLSALETGSSRIDGGAPLAELLVEDRGWRGRGGRLVAPGRTDWRPLVELRLRGFGRAFDGGFRIVRCRHFFDADGYRSELEFLERGLDLDAWTGAVSRGTA
jgi:phage protein D